jgi:Cd2+/Zn2+-exporting ATPase
VVTDVIPLGELKENELLSMAASIESRSEHILAEAVLNKAKERNIPIQELEDFAAIPGQGATAKINNEIYRVGSKTMCGRLGILSAEAENRIKALEEEGKTVIALTGKSRIMGIIAARDELRPEARDALRKLKQAGIRTTVMLTGDNMQVAKVMAAEAGIDEYMAQLLPEEKVGAIKNIKGRHGITAMVGDGVNDAPAMVASDLGIAMGAAGTDVAIETGDIILMSDNLLKIPYVIDLGRRTVLNIRGNIFISLLIIGFLVPMALLGRIGLVPGLLINEIGGLLVIINGLRLLR